MGITQWILSNGIPLLPFVLWKPKSLHSFNLSCNTCCFRLQGSICVQVNAGPLAYANAFLDPTLAPMYPDDLVDKLKATFK